MPTRNISQLQRSQNDSKRLLELLEGNKLPSEVAGKIDTDRINEEHEDFLKTRADLPIAINKKQLQVRTDKRAGTVM